jgi:hypothetical protein
MRYGETPADAFAIKLCAIWLAAFEVGTSIVGKRFVVHPVVRSVSAMNASVSCSVSTLSYAVESAELIGSALHIRCYLAGGMVDNFR